MRQVELAIWERTPRTPSPRAKLVQLAEKSREIGLTMNKSKTKIMTNKEQEDIEVDGEKIEYVTQYIYLGQTISFKDQIDLELERRVTCAWKRPPMALHWYQHENLETLSGIPKADSRSTGELHKNRLMMFIDTSTNPNPASRLVSVKWQSHYACVGERFYTGPHQNTTICAK
ncbi:uncharacterized protein [Maniola hyperantus]|uniref:uncharacterized protein n=1 Tax=Aphantopus hyperantus TaxID=2795564 RepID=UPI0037493EF6